MTDYHDPKILAFLCNWCAYAGADLAGVSRIQFPPNIRAIRVMCSGRVDSAFIFQAFLERADGVLIGGCHLADCHYIHGNYQALSMVHLCKKILERMEINPERLRIEWVSAAEGIRFAEIITHFTKLLKELGPLGASEGKDLKTLKLRLNLAKKLTPYMKLAEREKLRLPQGEDEGFAEFFSHDEVKRVFDELLVDKLMMSEVLLRLGEGSSLEEISVATGLDVSQVARYLESSLKKGLLRFDQGERKFRVA